MTQMTLKLYKYFSNQQKMVDVYFLSKNFTSKYLGFFHRKYSECNITRFMEDGSVQMEYLFSKTSDCPDLPQRAPRDVIPSQEKRVELLEKFNFPQWSYRDLLPVPRKYSEEHKEYLSTTDIIQKIDIAKRIKSRCT